MTASSCLSKYCLTFTCRRLLLWLLLLLLLLLMVERAGTGRWDGLRCTEVLRLRCRMRAVRRGQSARGRRTLEGCVIPRGGLSKAVTR